MIAPRPSICISRSALMAPGYPRTLRIGREVAWLRLGSCTDHVISAAAATPDLAAAVYAASAMAIRVDTPAERSYLAQLAARLRLSPAVRASLDASLGVGRGAATA